MIKLDFGSGWGPGFFFFFSFGCNGSSLLHGLFSSCGERGLLFFATHRLLIVEASFVEHVL